VSQVRGSDLSRLVSNEAIALLAAFVLVVVGGSALAERYVDPSAQLLTKTAAAAEQAGSYRFVTTQRYSGEVPRGGAYAAGVQLSGFVDLDADVSRFETVINLGRIDAKCAYMSIGDDLYVAVHPSRRNEFGASWLRTSGERSLAAANLQGLRPDQLNEHSVKFFAGLEPAGEATVRGVRTTRYRGEVDIAALAGGRTTPRAQIELGRTLPVSVYIDEDGLLRRLTIEISSARRFGVTFTTDLFDYGRDARITRPAPGAVKAGNAQMFAVACYPKTFPGTPTPRR
jgi:hypothetical protein